MIVTIVDDVVLPTESVERWLALWEADYAPAARSRGLVLEGVWTSGATDPRCSHVVVRWEAPSVGAFWAVRRDSAADPSVAAFWQVTDAMASARDRRVLVPVGAS